MLNVHSIVMCFIYLCPSVCDVVSMLNVHGMLT